MGDQDFADDDEHRGRGPGQKESSDPRRRILSVSSRPSATSDTDSMGVADDARDIGLGYRIPGGARPPGECGQMRELPLTTGSSRWFRFATGGRGSGRSRPRFPARAGRRRGLRLPFGGRLTLYPEIALLLLVILVRDVRLDHLVRHVPAATGGGAQRGGEPGPSCRGSAKYSVERFPSMPTACTAVRPAAVACLPRVSVIAKFEGGQITKIEGRRAS